METFDALGDPVRRRILEHLSRGGELSAGGIAALVADEFAISQPAVSQHLRVLRESGLVAVRAEGRRRVYALRPGAILEAEGWLGGLREFWSQRLDALETELRRGARERARAGHGGTGPGATAGARTEAGTEAGTDGAGPTAPDPRRTA